MFLRDYDGFLSVCISEGNISHIQHRRYLKSNLLPSLLSVSSVPSRMHWSTIKGHHISLLLVIILKEVPLVA
jgi:hypothetical protein